MWNHFLKYRISKLRKVVEYLKSVFQLHVYNLLDANVNRRVSLVVQAPEHSSPERQPQPQQEQRVRVCRPPRPVRLSIKEPLSAAVVALCVDGARVRVARRGARRARVRGVRRGAVRGERLLPHVERLRAQGAASRHARDAHLLRRAARPRARHRRPLALIAERSSTNSIISHFQVNPLCVVLVHVAQNRIEWTLDYSSLASCLLASLQHCQ